MAVLTALFGFHFASAQEKNIAFEQLPAEAQVFVKNHFPNLKVVSVFEDVKPNHSEYDVLFENGTEIEFSSNGDWEEVTSRANNELPASVVPPAILQHIKNQFPNTFVREIKKKRYGFEVEISNGSDLEFDKNGNFLRFDK